jgi:hypothetical protein
VQYVALRNIDLLLQAKPDILSKELRVFFCKYNDPPYVKLQKLEIMVRIANEKNFDQLLSELKEYALEVDMDFVKRAVKAIGQVAIKIEPASEKCVNALLDLIATKVNYVVQEVIVVIKDILRKYPGYEGVIPTLCKYIDELDEPNARGSLIWIVGEYAEKINNADDILSGFVDVFAEEFTQVSLLTPTLVQLALMLRRHNYKSSQPLSSCSLRSPATTKAWYKRSCSSRQQTATTLISATAPTFTGVSFLATSTSQRFVSRCMTSSSSVTDDPHRASSLPKSRPSQLPSAVFLPSSSNNFSQSSPPSLRSTTSRPSRSSARAVSAPRPSSAPPSRNSARISPRTPLPRPWPRRPPTGRLAAARSRATSRTYWISISTGLRRQAPSRIPRGPGHPTGWRARCLLAGRRRPAAGWQISWGCLTRRRRPLRLRSMVVWLVLLLAAPLRAGVG